ncbi:MAG: hypothetical protein M3063_07445 [Actinomycetota bacterium]|nr:hypothetical protein [Actinomycetota bacterium]
MLDRIASALTTQAYGNPAPTAPSSQVSNAFNTLVGDLKWIAGAAAVVGIIVLVIMGVVAHREGRGVTDVFGGFVKVIFLLIIASSAVTLVTTFLS